MRRCRRRALMRNEDAVRTLGSRASEDSDIPALSFDAQRVTQRGYSARFDGERFNYLITRLPREVAMRRRWR